MKKIVAAALLLLLVPGWMPFSRGDVGTLQPVRALVVSRQGSLIVLDGGQVQGRGTTWEAAMEDLLESGSGKVFLGTADQIVLVQTAVGLLPKVLSEPTLRPSAQVCVSEQPVTEVSQTADFLAAHETGVTVARLRTVLANAESLAMPVLRQTEGGLRIHVP